MWVALAISSLSTTLTMFQSPGREYLIHCGLLFRYTVVAHLSWSELWASRAGLSIPTRLPRLGFVSVVVSVWGGSQGWISESSRRTLGTGSLLMAEAERQLVVVVEGTMALGPTHHSD
jgi:hypothetical protein